MIDIYDALRLALDTGILALIWLVQLIIYPGLARYSETELRTWHPLYTKRVTFIVLPLMFGQLAISAYIAITNNNLLDYIHLSMVLSAWGITFLKAVPLHNTLESEYGGTKNAIRLTQVNKYRTFIWSLVWIISVISVIF